MLTLQWLLRREDLALRLVAGADPSLVAIDWVHSIELMDPRPWLQGRELVLTTGLRLPRARTEQAAYARRLADADVAALAFGTGVRFDAIPPALRDACVELGLPLVEVPLPTPFVAVTQAIAARIAELQYESMQHTVDFQRRLTAAALTDGPSGVVRGLADELDAGVVLLDDRHRVVESARQRPDLAERVRVELGRHTGQGRTSMHVVETDRSIEWQSLSGPTGSSGWLAIDTAESLSSADRVPLNQALSLLALLRDRPRDVLDQRRRVGAVVLDLLLDPETNSATAREHLRGFGFEPDDAMSVIVVLRDDTLGVDRLAESLDTLRLPYVVTAGEDSSLVTLVRAVDTDVVVEHLAASGRGPDSPAVGASAPVDQDRCATGLAQARQAAESARWGSDRVARYASLTLASVLDDDTVRTRIGELTDATLAPLGEHPVLLESLETYLRTNGSWETASRISGVHRHTLRNRMAKVEELTGLSLDVAENRTLLLLGLMSR